MMEYSPEWLLEFKLLRQEAWASAEELLVAGGIATQTDTIEAQRDTTPSEGARRSRRFVVCVE